MDRYEFTKPVLAHILAKRMNCGVVELKASKSRCVPALEWLGDFAGRDARITSMGADMLLVENHLGINAFSDTCITLSTRRGNIKICGRNLRLNQVRCDAMVIRGGITEIHLPCREDHHEP